MTRDPSDTELIHMDCRTFRRDHCAFVDDTLPRVDMQAMELHRAECGQCADHDSRVRRSLLLARNLPPLECSSDFSERLFARLRELHVSREPELAFRATSRASYVLVAATMLIAASGAWFALRSGGTYEVMMPPVVAMEPAPRLDPLSTPSFVASASAGVALWPMLLLADELPMHMAEGFQLTGASY